ncbi:ChrR family anti-sigma-E factor [Methyloceanibacter sp.]|uniref:ChrR family anti-sigma-E factor n=1 Tax=Methyloceanibacter sp. TaxID=1965321 RepID=UPI00356A6F60|nr:ChrR family anti-sigma-E factor [Phycisphaerae bacterium]
MKIEHHPDTATLASYAAGSLDEAFATVVAAHLASCAKCRARLHEIEEVGGTMLETIDAVGLNEAALERAMSRLDEPSEERAEPRSAEQSLPRPLGRLVTAPLDAIAWKSVAPGVAVHRLPTSKAARGSLTLLKIAPGKKIPEHGHGGMEITLVLTGSYRDALGRFGPGDVADLDEDIEHQPVVDSDEPCICLVASEAPTRFKSFFGRLFQPLVGV